MSKSKVFDPKDYSIMLTSPDDFNTVRDSGRIDTTFSQMPSESYYYPFRLLVQSGVVVNYKGSKDGYVSVKEWLSLTQEVEL